MKMTIGKRITAGFAITVLITGALGAFTYSKLSSIRVSADEVTTDSFPGTKIALEISAASRQNVANLLQQIVTNNPDTLKEIDVRIDEYTKIISSKADEYKATIFDAEDRGNFEEYTKARANWTGVRNRIRDLARAGKSDEAANLYEKEGLNAVAGIDRTIKAIVDYNVRGAAESTATLDNAVHGAMMGVLIGVVGAVLASIAIGFVIIRGVSAALGRMADSLGDGSNQVAAAASQVSSSSQMLAQGASEQAASLEETSSALEEMSSMTKKNAESAHQANTLSSDAKTSADKGNLAMQKMTTAINDIQKSATETAKIVKVIDEIAFQTNLLALNAAVEAARAGEAGKGFAVVAEEVRNLAMRSAEAAKNTSAMIEQSVQNSRNGVAIAGEVGKVLEEITVSSGKVSALIGEIAAASQEQSQGIGQVNTAVSQMDKVTQSNAAAAEESASASEELASQASQMSGVVHELMLLVGRQSQAVAKPVAKAKPRVLTPARPSAQSAKAAKAHAEFPLEDDAAESNDFSDFNVGKAA